MVYMLHCIHAFHNMLGCKLGHAFAAGGILALVHDYRVMRTGRGWFCMPEIKLKLTFTMDFLELAK